MVSLRATTNNGASLRINRWRFIEALRSARAAPEINDAEATCAQAARPRLSFNASTVLAQDHFYSDFLSLSLTILTHKGSMMMTDVCCGAEMCLGIRHRWDESFHIRRFEWIQQTLMPKRWRAKQCWRIYTTQRRCKSHQ